MAKDLSDTVRDTLTHVVRDAAKTMQNGKKGGASGALSGGRGVAAGAGLAALVPLAAKVAKGRLASGAAKSVVKKPGKALGDASSKLGDSVGKRVGDTVKDKVDESGGVGGIAKEAGKGLLPFGGGGESGGGGQSGTPGVGKGRRMPIQQSMDVAVPIETCYNQWTQFDVWPEFMHRVTRVTQEDPCTVSFATKIWGKTKEFTADIETQRPDERIKWRVSQGITHTGVVTFHELAPNLTRVELSVDVDPGSLLEKAARGMRHIKRAMRADLHRFKAFIEMQEQETGAWRGVIEDGELVEDHDPSYDEERDFSEIEDLHGDAESDDEQEEDAEEPQAEEEEEEEEEPEAEEPEAEEEQEQPRSRKSRSRSQSQNGNGSKASSRRRGSSKASSRNGGSGGSRKRSSRKSTAKRS